MTKGKLPTRGCAASSDLRMAVIRRDGGACVICESTSRLNVERWLVFEGDEPGNLFTICSNCAARRHGLTNPEMWLKMRAKGIDVAPAQNRVKRYRKRKLPT